MSLQTINWLNYASRNGGWHTAIGNMKVGESLWSPQLSNHRDVTVYLPPTYNAYLNKRYPVVYMHDGQNLFDRATGFAGQEWEVDETMERLSAHDHLEAIIVGVWHMGQQRLDEYSPFYDTHHNMGGRGDEYLAFVANTLKPIIDRDFRTLGDRTHTGLMGSSMGGLISLYGYFKYAHVFGFAGVMSPAFWFANQAIYRYVQSVAYLPGRIYLDHGSRENSPWRMYSLLVEKGFRPDLEVKYVREEGAEHTESAWARRLPDALRFLIPKVK